MWKILVADPIAKEGIDLLKPHAQVDVRLKLKPEELKAIIGDYDALLVRSETKVTADIIEAGKKLQTIGRAGVGVDNIDLNAATGRGIVVVNAPTSNVIAVAELTLALMLALARNIPAANTSLKKGEWRRADFMGSDLRNKVLGIIGLGKVGSEVTRRVKSFEMRVVAYDPFVPADYARNLGVDMVSMEELLKQSDYITVHTPITNTTKGLIGAKELALVKPSVRIINTARGGIVDEEALAKAVEEGRVGGVALDTFTEEPPKKPIRVMGMDKALVTPHLGASTAEAQTGVAIEVAEQALAVLEGRPARYAVNAPIVVPEALRVLEPYVDTATVMGNLATQLADGQLQSILIRYDGDIAKYDSTILKAAVVRGLMASISEERVNVVNVNLVAERRGLRITEQKQTADSHNYTNLLTVELTTSAGKTILSGTSMRDETHIVRINDYWMDVVPTTSYMLVTDHRDRPGLIGMVGSITGAHDINISFMEVGRREVRGRAMMVLGLDDPMPDSVLKKVTAIPDMFSVKLVHIRK